MHACGVCAGRLGDGTTTHSSVPVRVTGLTGVKSILNGNFHTCASVDNGTAYCWGFNWAGESKGMHVLLLISYGIAGQAPCIRCHHNA